MRAAKKSAREDTAQRFVVTADNAADVGYELLSQLYALAMTADDEGTRVRAASRALAHLLPSLRAVEHEISGLDPINVSELEQAANAARHGEVDPAEWTPAAGVPVESEAVRRRRQYRQQKERERENGETNENLADH